MFGRPFVKRFALYHQTVVCPVCLFCLSVMLVGWIKMKLGMLVGLGTGHIGLDGDPAPHPLKGHGPPPSIFGPYLVWPNGWMD